MMTVVAMSSQAQNPATVEQNGFIVLCLEIFFYSSLIVDVSVARPESFLSAH